MVKIVRILPTGVQRTPEPLPRFQAKCLIHFDMNK